MTRCGPLVLRLNTPGGDVLASELIRQELECCNSQATARCLYGGGRGVRRLLDLCDSQPHPRIRRYDHWINWYIWIATDYRAIAGQNWHSQRRRWHS